MQYYSDQHAHQEEDSYLNIAGDPPVFAYCSGPEWRKSMEDTNPNNVAAVSKVDACSSSAVTCVHPQEPI